MESALSRIELYNTLFYIFAAFAAVSFAVAVVLFFRFDILETYAIMTGRTRRKTIQQMEKQNNETGKLRMKYPISNTGDTSGHSGRSSHGGKHTGQTGEKKGHTGQTGRKTGHTGTTGERPARLGQTAGSPPSPERRSNPVRKTAPPVRTERPETAILAVETPETAVLQPVPETSYPSEELGKTEILSKPSHSDFVFLIKENIIEIHTNELI